LGFQTDSLELDVVDHGRGFEHQRAQQGIGVVAMRERAELLGGSIDFLRPPEGGTRVLLRVPRERVDSNGR
jgi:signal transduction histidine kinase